MASFNFEEFVRSRSECTQEIIKDTSDTHFYEICEKVKAEFYKDWEQKENARAGLELQKKAIIGYKKEKEFFFNRINSIVREIKEEYCSYPSWYENLTEAIYHENWGMAGIAEWFMPKYRNSSSAKIIGNKIFFMENGHMALKQQTISKERMDQLIKAFLLLTPTERMDKAYHETYLMDGTRVTVFTEPMAKNGQASIIFRRYLVPSLTFEEQAFRKTIPFRMIPMLTAMVGIGFNVVFLGAVRTAKTTFLSTWQSYEDESLEGVMVETDPEIPMHNILPKAPIIQLIADGDDLRVISKNLLRSDADYFILAEARDGIALDTAVKIAAKGTKRMKLTFHSRLPKHFPLEAATEIVKQTGGDLNLTMQMIASGFDYLFHFIQLPDKSQKRLKGIYQMKCSEDGRISIDSICEYDVSKECWKFNYLMDKEIEEYALESNAYQFDVFKNELKVLSEMGEIR